MLALCLHLFLRLLDTTHNDPITADTVVTISAHLQNEGVNFHGNWNMDFLAIPRNSKLCVVLA